MQRDVLFLTFAKTGGGFRTFRVSNPSLTLTSANVVFAMHGMVGARIFGTGPEGLHRDHKARLVETAITPISFT